MELTTTLPSGEQRILLNTVRESLLIARLPLTRFTGDSVLRPAESAQFPLLPLAAGRDRAAPHRAPASRGAQEVAAYGRRAPDLEAAVREGATWVRRVATDRILLTLRSMGLLEIIDDKKDLRFEAVNPVVGTLHSLHVLSATHLGHFREDSASLCALYRQTRERLVAITVRGRKGERYLPQVRLRLVRLADFVVRLSRRSVRKRTSVRIWRSPIRTRARSNASGGSATMCRSHLIASDTYRATSRTKRHWRPSCASRARN